VGKPCNNVVHAEANAIAFAAKYGVGVDGAEIHTTRVPCMACAGSIINAGIRRVVWYEEHRDMDGFLRLGEAGLEVIRYDHE
jgi:dCMP deaminase